HYFVPSASWRRASHRAGWKPAVRNGPESEPAGSRRYEIATTQSRLEAGGTKCLRDGAGWKPAVRNNPEPGPVTQTGFSRIFLDVADDFLQGRFMANQMV